ncbi:MAG: transglycosylase SLT domain-containing protein [Burkholderiaceae bacterium]
MRGKLGIRHTRPAVRRLAAFLASGAGRTAIAAALVLKLSPGLAQIIEQQVAPAMSIGAGIVRPIESGPAIRLTPKLDRGQVERMRQITEIGARLEPGADLEREFRAALAFYCDAARTGSTDALVRLGGLYANGRGVARDDAVAATLFRRAASFGSEVGRQMSLMIQTYEERLPDCLQGELVSIDAPAATILYGPRPQPAATGNLALRPPSLSDPARFDRVRPTAGQRRIAQLVLRLSSRYRIDPRLVMAVIRAESNFDAGAISSRNAIGLMQLIPETAARFSITDPRDPEQNLRGGIAYLRWLLAYFRGDVVLALAGYNAGEGAVDRFGGVPPFPETMAYVQRIQAIYPRDRHAYDPAVTDASPIFTRISSSDAPPLPRQRAIRVN